MNELIRDLEGLLKDTADVRRKHGRELKNGFMVLAGFENDLYDLINNLEYKNLQEEDRGK